jgi:hypothetical protein
MGMIEQNIANVAGVSCSFGGISLFFEEPNIQPTKVISKHVYITNIIMAGFITAHNLGYACCDTDPCPYTDPCTYTNNPK